MDYINYEDFNNNMDKDLLITKPRTITFVSAHNHIMNATISINIEDGDVVGIVNHVAEKGGIFGKNLENGEYFFIPWPCAIITITN